MKNRYNSHNRKNGDITFEMFDLTKIDKTLVEIAIYDESLENRLEAIGGITNQTILTLFAIETLEGEIGSKAVEGITDETLLFQVVDEANTIKAKEQALKSITNNDFLFGYAMRTQNLHKRRLAFESITDTELRSKIDKEILRKRIEEVRNITSKISLVNISVGEELLEVRLEALKRITDSDLVGVVKAISSKKKVLSRDDIRIQSKAIESITSQKSFIDIAMSEDINLKSRIEALKYIIGDDNLCEVMRLIKSERFIMNETDIGVRLEIVNIIENQRILINIVVDGTENFRVRFNAFKALKNENVRKKTLSFIIGCNEDDFKSQFGSLTDQVVIAVLALSACSRSEDVDLALNSLTDNNILAQVAKKTKNSWARSTSLELITNIDFRLQVEKEILQDRLEEIMKTSDQVDLIKIAGGDEVMEVKLKALNGITDDDLLEELIKFISLKPGRTKHDICIQYEAIKLISDQSSLSSIAISNDIFGLRYEALNSITDDDIFELTMKCISSNFSTLTLNGDETTIQFKRLDDITNQTTLTFLIMSTPNYDIEIEKAIESIRDLDNLSKIAINAIIPTSRLKAIQMMMKLQK